MKLWISPRAGEEGGRGRRKRRKSQLQCSLPQQCTRVVLMVQGNCLFPVNKEEKEQEEEEGGEEGGGGGDHNCNAVFCSNAPELYSCAMAIIFSQ